MLCVRNKLCVAGEMFQSSPALTGGCYFYPGLEPVALPVFQSSPALTGGCYVARHTGYSLRGSFNPHPPLRADAIKLILAGRKAERVSILTRPYGRMLCRSVGGGDYISDAVSILTRPYGRMLLASSFAFLLRCGVSILTRPYGRMLSAFSSILTSSRRGFNPHPPLRADAILQDAEHYSTLQCFNPHPPLRADAIRQGLLGWTGGWVSILTRPYGRMLCGSPYWL